jgi:plastocyanin
VLLLPFLLLSACGEADLATGSVPVVTFVATDFGYEGPAEIPAGLTEVRLENQGQEVHHLQLVLLEEGATIEQLEESLSEAPESMPDYVTMLGGPNGAMPGQTINAYVDLEAGSYATLCTIPSPDGTPHVHKGMIRPLQVLATDVAEAAEAPDPDFVIEGLDFAFSLPDDIAPGDYTIRFENAGEEPHEVVVVRLDEGATAMDFAAAFGPDAPPGPPPGQTVGGTVGIEPGDAQSFDVSLENGSYALMCFFINPATGAPHFMLGMSREFVVQ